MNTFFWSKTIFIGLFFILVFGCNKEDTVVEPNINYGHVTDIDGNVYRTVAIGSQTWMADNLRTTTYNDGTKIPNLIINTEWKDTNKGAYCWYNNDLTNKDVYGALYNWFTISTGKLCPIGWHSPSTPEWKILKDYLGGVEIAGGKMKDIGTKYWKSPNTGATNSTGFSGIPSGVRSYDGGFHLLGEMMTSWGSEQDPYMGMIEDLNYNDQTLFTLINFKNSGYSVRCLKD